MKKLSLVLWLVLTTVGTMLAQRSISGVITDAAGEPLIGASVLIKGTSSGTVTEIDGTYKLDVPEDATQIIVSYTGYKTQELDLGVSNVVDIIMSEGVEALEEVVVTGLGIRKEKKALGYGVSTIGAENLAQRAESDVARLLRGKATGVNITSTSGLAGSGTNIIIRGYSSITGSNQPLFVVDGVPFNTDANANQDASARDGSSTASSRFLDLDPNNIEEINILKGLSATVLYGEAGRNGVILVTTKNGSASPDADKKFEISFNQSVSLSEVANLPDYQDVYGNGFSGNFGWFFSNWGPAFDVRGSNGIAEDGTVDHPYDQPQYNDDFPEFIGARYDYRPYSGVEDFFQTGLINNSSLSIRKNLGGGSAVNASYSYLDDEGFLPGNVLQKHNFGLGGVANLSNGLRLNGSFNYSVSERQYPPAAFGFGSNPDAGNASIFSNVLYTPRSIDLFGLPFESPLDGSMVYYRRGSAIQNPRWTLANAVDVEDVKRFFGNFTLSYDLTDWLNASYRVGIDQYAQQQRRTVNKGGSQVPDGLIATSERLNNILDQVLNLTSDFELSNNFDLNVLVGANFRRETRDQTIALSTQQFIFDLFTHDNFINHQNFSFIREENTIGAYGTVTLGFKDFAYLNLNGRNDWTSTLEQPNRSIFYPSASVSFIASEAIPALQSSNLVNYLKVRVGYGTSAGYPDPYQTRNILSTATNQFVSSGGSVLNTNSIDDRLGNLNLEPEVHSEIELGIEANLFYNRLGIDLSLYDKESSDLIIDLDLDPSTGFTNTTINAASITNRGIELGLNITPFKGAFNWTITSNFTRNVSEVESIADGVDQVLIAGASSSLGNFAIPGQPYGVMLGDFYERDENGTLEVGSDGNYIISQDIDVIGDPNPEFITSLINSFSWKGLTVDIQWDYTHRGDIYSVTTATLLARGNTVETSFDRFLPIILPGIKQADGLENDQQAYAGDLGFDQFFGAAEGTIFDGTTIRLREVSLSYDFPAKLLERTPFGSLSFRFFGENLFYDAVNFPDGVNFDPEVLSLGVGNGQGFDFLTGPTAKKYGASLRVTF